MVALSCVLDWNWKYLCDRGYSEDFYKKGGGGEEGGHSGEEKDRQIK